MLALRTERPAVASASVLALAWATSCADARSTAPPPRLTERDVWGVFAGDALDVRVFDDPWLSATVVVDDSGSADIPGCGTVAVAGHLPTQVAPTIAACLVTTGAYERAPEVVVHPVHVAGRVSVVIGRDRDVHAVPFQPGLDLVSLFAIVLEPGEVPDSVVLQRKGARHEVDVRAILDGAAPRVPLARDDEILIEEDVTARGRAASVVMATGDRRARSEPAGSSLAGAECGDLLLELVALRAQGRGSRHPRMARVAGAITSRCSTDAAASSLESACRRALEERARESLDHGPMHPGMIALDAQLAVCPPPAGSAGRPDTDCAGLRLEREELVASGKGRRHPLVIAIDARLATCP